MARHKKQALNPRIFSAIHEKPIWRFDMIDRTGKFAFDLSREDFLHREVLQKIIEYCNMTWDEIGRQQHDRGKSKHHYLNVDGLSAEAKERLIAKRLEDDCDGLYSFALRNTLRLIGIRYGAEFHVIWYDLHHEFYPSHKK